MRGWQMIREEKVVILLCTTILFLFAVQLFLKTMYSTDGETLQRLQDDIVKVQEENMVLQDQILTLSSLTHINSEAKKEGFIKSEYISF